MQCMYLYIFRNFILKDLKAYGGAGYHYRRSGVCVTATKLRGHRYDPTTSKLKCHKNLKNCIIKHLLKEPFGSIEENYAQTRIFYNTPFKLRGNHFFVHGTENRCVSVFMQFTYCFIYFVVFLKLKIQKNIS